MRPRHFFRADGSPVGLLNFFARGVQCGALGEAEVKATGLTMEELAAKSFAKIAAARAR